MPSIIVIDTETSDLEIDKGAALLEVAWIHLKPIEGAWRPIVSAEDFVAFGGEMSPQARAVHHIKPWQVLLEHGAHSRDEVIDKLLRNAEGDTVFAAHNYEFDAKFLPEVKGPWICTYRLAKHIWPDAPGYGNQVLRYWLGLEPAIENIMHRQPHQALFDVAITASILMKMLETHDLVNLTRLMKEPIFLKRMPFGKHKGEEFDKVPSDYLRWLNKQTNLDPDLRYTLDIVLR